MERIERIAKKIQSEQKTAGYLSTLSKTADNFVRFLIGDSNVAINQLKNIGGFVNVGALVGDGKGGIDHEAYNNLYNEMYDKIYKILYTRLNP